MVTHLNHLTHFLVEDGSRHFNNTLQGFHYVFVVKGAYESKLHAKSVALWFITKNVSVMIIWRKHPYIAQPKDYEALSTHHHLKACVWFYEKPWAAVLDACFLVYIT